MSKRPGGQNFCTDDYGRCDKAVRTIAGGRVGRGGGLIDALAVESSAFIRKVPRLLCCEPRHNAGDLYS